MANDQKDTCRYFRYQIQSDVSNVCGEYSLLLLHNVVNLLTPWKDAYTFWTGIQNMIYLIPFLEAQYTRKQNRKKELLPYQQKQFLHNDKLVRTIVVRSSKVVWCQPTAISPGDVMLGWCGCLVLVLGNGGGQGEAVVMGLGW